MSDFVLLQFDIFFYQAQAVTLTVSKAFELATDLHNEKAITSPNKETVSIKG